MPTGKRRLQSDNFMFDKEQRRDLRMALAVAAWLREKQVLAFKAGLPEVTFDIRDLHLVNCETAIKRYNDLAAILAWPERNRKDNESTPI